MKTSLFNTKFINGYCVMCSQSIWLVSESLKRNLSYILREKEKRDKISEN